MLDSLLLDLQTSAREHIILPHTKEAMDMLAFISIMGAIGILLAVIGFFWLLDKSGNNTALWLYATGVTLLLIAGAEVSLNSRSLQYACSYRSYPAQVIWMSDQELLLQFTSFTGEDKQPSLKQWLVDRPAWLQTRTTTAPSPEMQGQTWVVEEQVQVGDKTLIQPVLTTYTEPAKPGG